MKALLLAAGLGTRLRPITDKVPKCLVLIADKPLLAYHFDALKKIGVMDVLINTHYLADQVDDFIKNYRSLNPNFNITTAYEPELLGSAGTLRNNREFFKDEKDFLVLYGDNLTNIDYKKMIDFHLSRAAICTIACYYEEHIEQKGMIIMKDDDEIAAFKEKPKPEEVVSHYANAGLYAVNQRIFDILSNIKKEGLLDFGQDVFPELLRRQEKIYAYLMTEHLLDIGNLENYNLAQSLIHGMYKK